MQSCQERSHEYAPNAELRLSAINASIVKLNINKPTMNEFRELAKPLVEWLRNNYHPHATIIIGYDFAEVLEGKQGEPFPIDKEDQK